MQYQLTMIHSYNVYTIYSIPWSNKGLIWTNKRIKNKQRIQASANFLKRAKLQSQVLNQKISTVWERRMLYISWMKRHSLTYFVVE